ncbi:hypothetical protein M8J76_010802 [Diaphorina citri]|nr:hypothetical protein M8J76_010802 [Diaphorina citri]
MEVYPEDIRLPDCNPHKLPRPQSWSTSYQDDIQPLSRPSLAPPMDRIHNASSLALELSTEFFMIHHEPPLAPPTYTPPPPLVHKTLATPPSSVNILRREVWVMPLFVLSFLTMTLIAMFEVFVLCKTWKTTPSRRHLLLGQMLLLGLFICAAVSAVILLEPSPLTCSVIRMGTGLGYAIVFSTLLVKCVFLISLNTGVYLPAPYQALLLFFAVTTQLIPGIQGTFCSTSFSHILLSLVYSMFLMIAVTVLAIRSRNIRDNYREITFIGLALYCVIPVWMGWICSGIIVFEKNKDACVSFGLSVTAILIFLIMFMPKSRQLAAMGKEGMYLEDKDEKYSTVSGAMGGVGASPSFFHVKAPKYNADRVALMTSPPSYGHYYQYCYYPHNMHSPAANPPVYDYQSPEHIWMSEPPWFDPSDLKPTYSSNPNVFFQRPPVIHPGMMY